MIAVCAAWDETAFSTCHLIINFLVEQVSCPLLLVMCLAVVEASQIVLFWFADVVLVKTCSAVRPLATLFSAKAFFGHLCLWNSFFPTLQLLPWFLVKALLWVSPAVTRNLFEDSLLLPWNSNVLACTHFRRLAQKNSCKHRFCDEPINWQTYSGRHSYKSEVHALEYDFIYVFRFTDQFAHIKSFGSFFTRWSLQSRWWVGKWCTTFDPLVKFAWSAFKRLKSLAVSRIL